MFRRASPDSHARALKAGVSPPTAVRRIALSGVVCGVCAWLACDSGRTVFTNVPLDGADAVITITRAVADSDSAVAAKISGPGGANVLLVGDQAVLVNDQQLTGPDLNAEYTQVIAKAGVYTVTVREPTRGVEDTDIASPGDFEITSPSEGQEVSLSGFTLTWSNVDPDLDVEVALEQTLFGERATASFDPVADSGTFSFSALDLRDFRQGAPLIITVAKISRRDDVNGFSSGTLSVLLSRTVSAEPGP